MPAGYTASAWASSVVDQAQKLGGGGLDGGDRAPDSPPEVLIDPDIHDVFGAHASAAPPLLPPALGGPMVAHCGSSGITPPRSPFAPDDRAAGGGGGANAGSLLGEHRAMLLEPSTVHGQHSVTVHDPQARRSDARCLGGESWACCRVPLYSSRASRRQALNSTKPKLSSDLTPSPQGIVPSYHFLRQRALAKAKLAEQGVGAGGYIAEAKRVLNAAVNTAEPSEAATVETSSAGAIGPLLK